ncbi:MAG: N-acetylneuraminate synthase [Myxococcales bacterium]|nr:MAG: N-acetylneuraminate synthase [Myxococcales bacterium]
MTPSHVTVIAEAGVNHNGSLDLALRLVDVASEVGVDAVKFQTFKAGSLVSRRAQKADYQKRTTDAGETQLAMLQRLELSEADHRTLIARCAERGVAFLSSPFDEPSLELLIALGLRRLKIGSGQINHAPFLLAAARTGRPLILSTGMSTLADVEAALAVVAFGLTAPPDARPTGAALTTAFASAEGQAALARQVTLLHCTTEYPAPFAEVNLRAMDTLRAAFGLEVGFSDHTPGIAMPIAAVARGATVIEKHFTLDRTMEGPDHRASLEPAELRALVEGVRQVSVAIGDGRKVATPSETPNRAVARLSLVAARAVKAGDEWTTETLAVKRPGTGLSPHLYWQMLGRRAARDHEADELLDEGS